MSVALKFQLDLFVVLSNDHETNGCCEKKKSCVLLPIQILVLSLDKLGVIIFHRFDVRVFHLGKETPWHKAKGITFFTRFLKENSFQNCVPIFTPILFISLPPFKAF